MLITRPAPHQLRLESPRAILAFVAAFFAAFILLIAVMFYASTTIRLDHQAGTCSVTVWRVFGTESRTMPLADIDYVDAQKTTKHESLLHTRRGAYSLGRGDALAGQVQGFLDTPSPPPLEVSSDSGTGVLMLLLPFGIVGLVGFGLTRQEILLDKEADTLDFVWRYPWGPQRTRMPLSALVEVELVPPATPKQNYAMRFKFTDGREMRVDPQRSTFEHPPDVHAKLMGFLGPLPVVAPIAPPLAPHV